MKEWTYSKETWKGIHLKTKKIIGAFLCRMPVVEPKTKEFKMKPTTRRNSAIALAALMAGLPIVATSCDTGDSTPPAPQHDEFENVTLTGANAWANSDLNIRKTYGLSVSDAQLTKLVDGYNLGGNGALTAYIAGGNKLNITINNGNTVSAADGRFVIGTAWIDSHSTTDIITAINNYATVHLVLFSRNQAFDKSKAILKQCYISVHEGKIYKA